MTDHHPMHHLTYCFTHAHSPLVASMYLKLGPASRRLTRTTIGEVTGFTVGAMTYEKKNYHKNQFNQFNGMMLMFNFKLLSTTNHLITYYKHQAFKFWDTVQFTN